MYICRVEDRIGNGYTEQPRADRRGGRRADRGVGAGELLEKEYYNWN